MGGRSTQVGSGRRDRIIARPRLIRLLDEAEARRILLIAPAGYGKTTLARQWLAEKSRQAVWLRATPASTDVAALAMGIAKAADEILTGALARMQERLRNSQSPNSEADQLGTILGEDFVAWPDDCWMVIDDYQNLSAEPAAERFIEAFLTRSDIPLLVTSRRRPTWASAKRLLYGEIVELGRNVLAMTHEEAGRALPPKHGALSGLVALAEGWPAVIGLASLVKSPLPLPGDEMPETLHSYFAEELYQDLTTDAQWDLVQLALAPSLNSDLAAALFGDRAKEVLEHGYERGFLTRDVDFTYDLHPLLRQFLRSKLVDADADAVAKTVTAIGAAAVDRSAWDEAFALATEFELNDLLTEVLGRALDDLLAEGRLATLEHWITVGQGSIPGDHVIPLAQMEVAFRKGRWSESERKALALARTIPARHPFAPRALFRAAQVAQLDDRQEEALKLLEEARARSTSPSDLRRAAWSRLITLADLEEPELAKEALEEFEALAPESVEDVIRLSHAPVHLALRWGGIREELERHRATLDLLSGAGDPLVRSGFRQSYGTALNLAARYEEAYELAYRQIAEAERFGLDWVRPHGLEMQALAQIGLRDFEGAQAALRSAYRLAENARDVHAQINATALVVRIELAQGMAAEALARLGDASTRAGSPGMEGELRSIRALTLACLGRPEEAEHEIQQSMAITSHLEARGLRAYASVVVAHAREDLEGLKIRLREAIGDSELTGNADSFVTAYRAFPALLQMVAEIAPPQDEFLLLPLRLYDGALADRAGLRTREARVMTQDNLTEREEEVLSLLREGLSNRQIAHTLWIAESTVKVHVRHIFEKLGVRSRTAAALFRRDSEA
jgi:LuxR family transcriptional regulator, maltose regulon positive regulatory protein